MIKKLACFTTAAVIIMSTVTGCMSFVRNKSPLASEKTSKAKYILKLGYGGTTANPLHITAEKYAKWVNEKSKGKIEVKLFPGEVMGTDKQMTEAVARGSLDMNIGAQAITGSYAPKMAAIELPFLFKSFENVERVLDGPVGEDMAADLPAKGLRLLAYWDNGFRNISNNVRPIEKLADLKGLKIRAPESKTTISTLKVLGANPAPLAYPEVYIALSQHIFDGVEQPIANMYASKFYEVQRYMSILNYKYEPRPFQINESLWEGLPDDFRAILKEGAVIFAKEHRKLVKESELEMLNEMEDLGMKITKPDLTEFKEATKKIYTGWETFIPIPIETIEAVIEAAR